VDIKLLILATGPEPLTAVSVQIKIGSQEAIVAGPTLEEKNRTKTVTITISNIPEEISLMLLLTLMTLIRKCTIK